MSLQSAVNEDPAEFRIRFGNKYRGLKLKDIPKSELQEYAKWLLEQAAQKGQTPGDEIREFHRAVAKYVGETSH